MQRWPQGVSPEPIETWAEVHAYRSLRRAHDHALVVLAMGLPYWLKPDGHRYRLFVPDDQLEAVREQLRKFQRESRGWPPHPPIQPVKSAHASLADFYGPIGWVAVFSLAFAVQMAHPTLKDLGALNVERIADHGEFWRLATALLLHADLGHIVSNAISGACFGLLVQSLFGRVRAWLWIALTGILGNAINVLVYYPEQHLAIGASTAVFGALGLVIGGSMRAVLTAEGRNREAGAWKRRLAPLFAGIVLLGWFGGGGGVPTDGSALTTDVLAHVWGFLTGLVLGFWIQNSSLSG
ncbi:MAG: rhomboid family intramembrane serine protease [Opitutales bacterium]